MTVGDYQYSTPKVMIGEENVDVYLATYNALCELFTHVQYDDIEKIEEILFKHLMSSKKWSSMMSLDVWFFTCQ